VAWALGCHGIDQRSPDPLHNGDSIMADQWYFARDGKQFGPFSAAQLKGFAATRQLRPQDSVWKAGMAQRVLAAKVRQLFPPIQAHAPPALPAGQTIPVPSLARSPPRRLTPQPPGLVTDSAPPSKLLGEPATSLEPRSIIPDGLELVSIEDGTSAVAVSSDPTPRTGPEQPDVPQQEAVKKWRVIGVKGGVITSQDGGVVKYRKQCLKCRYADTSLTTMRIWSGFTRVHFFCPKCKKSQECVIQAVG
jgi:hypothetical protein